MGLFSKFFSKKEEKEKLPKKEPFHFDSPYCRFYYMSNPDTNEFGYEGEMKLSGDWAEYLTLYIDTDSPETLDANLCYTRLQNILSGREDINQEVKRSMTDYFLSRPELTDDSCAEQEILNGFELSWLGIFRNGEIQLSFDASGIYVSDITVRLKADGTKEIKYTDDNYEEHCDIL